MIPTTEDPRLAKVSRSRKIAEAIQGNAFATPSQAGVGQSGPYQVVKANPFGGIAQLAQAIIGQRGIEKADKEEAALHTTMLAEDAAKKQKRRDEVAKALTTYLPAAQDPSTDPGTRQAALVAAMSSLDPEDAGGALQQMLKSSLDPREMQNQRVAQVMGQIDKEWQGRQKQPKPRGPVLTPTGGGPDEGQVMQVAAQMTDEGLPVNTAMPMGEEEPDSESPEYYQHAAQKYEAAGLPQQAAQARKEAEKAAKEAKKEARGKSQDDWKIISGLRDDFNRDTKPFFDANRSYSRVMASASEPDLAGDMSLIYAFMKMLDDISVVREGEFATAQNAGSIMQSLNAARLKAVNGERLDPEVRAAFVKRAGLLREALNEEHKITVKGYEDTAKRLGQDPANIIRQTVKAQMTGAGVPKTAAPVAPAKPAAAKPAGPAADPLGIR